MRALVFLLVLLSAWYIAAAYRFRLLLMLCLAEGAVLALMPLLAAYLRARIRVSFWERTGEAVRGEARVCGFRVQNPSGLPAGRLDLRVSWLREGPRTGKQREPGWRMSGKQQEPGPKNSGKWREPDRNLGRQYGGQHPKHRGEWLHGGAERGESRLDFSVTAEHCGLLLLRLDRMRVYDCLLLFHASRRVREELRLAVYPPEAAVRVTLTGAHWDGTPLPLPGDESGEVLNIREYQPGDSLRRVHWNQSARTDRLWMKEFPREAGRRVHLLLDTAALSAPRGALSRSGRGALRPHAEDALPWAWDAFYEVFYALALGLLEAVASVRVYWLEGDAPRYADAENREQVREVLLWLYQCGTGSQPSTPTGGHGGGSASRAQNSSTRAQHSASWALLREQVPRGEPYLRLTGDLRLYAEESEAVRFRPEDLPRQFRETELLL